MRTPDEVLSFWLDEVGPAGWYDVDPALDIAILETFGSTWSNAREGACGLWLSTPTGTLAYVILTDQFSRNMFRGKAEAFASDSNARAAARIAIEREWDMQIREPARHFFYMPLMHSESLVDQDRAVHLIGTRLPETGANNHLHAKAHRDVIREFGRFPFRNAALGRANTPQEEEFLNNGGYGAAVRAQQDADH